MTITFQQAKFRISMTYLRCMLQYLEAVDQVGLYQETEKRNPFMTQRR